MLHFSILPELCVLIKMQKKLEPYKCKRTPAAQYSMKIGPCSGTSSD